MSWKNPRWNSLTGPDADALRQIFESLSRFLENPIFNNGIQLGNGSSPSYDAGTDMVQQPTQTPVDSDTLDDLAGDLGDLQDDLDELNNVTLPALQQEVDDILPITETKIGDNEISTPKLKAEAVTADKIAANTITANEIAADTITANEIAADTITSNEMTADAITARELAAIELEVGKHIRSTDYTPDVEGWSIESDGSAEFNDVKVRGEVVASEFHGAPTVNLLTNGDFEVDTTGWYADTGDYPLSTISRVTTTPHSGSGCLQVQASGAGYAAAATTISASAGDIIHATAWVRKATFFPDPLLGVNDVIFSIDFMDGSTPLTFNNRKFQIGTNWQFIEAYAAIPANQTDVDNVRVRLASYAAATAELFVDDVVVGLAPMLNVPYMVTNEDDSHLRASVMPNQFGFQAPYSSYPFGVQGGEIGEGIPALDVRGPSLGPTSTLIRMAQDNEGTHTIAEFADEFLVNGNPRIAYGQVLAGSNQTISDLSTTKLTMMNSVVFDSHGWADPANSRIVVGGTGVMMLSGAIRYGINSTGVRYVVIRVNGVNRLITAVGAAGGDNMVPAVSGMWPVSAGDVIELVARHSAGTNLDVSASSGQTNLNWIFFGM